MEFKNSVKKEVIINNAPCGFSKVRHKKRIKKANVQLLTLDDFKRAGEGAGAIVKAFLEGYNGSVNDK